MVFRDFDDMLSRLRDSARGGTIAVAGAADRHTLEAVLRAQDDGLVRPILVGDREKIINTYRELGRPAPGGGDIVHCTEPDETGAEAVRLVREGAADCLIKGTLNSSQYLRAVVDRERGLGTGRLMFHFVMMEIPNYHKVIIPVDTGMVLYPTLEQKKTIISATVDMLHRFGYEMPRVAVLACTENVNPKMPETLDAAALKHMNECGDIPGCVIEGPISYDCAMSADIAADKNYVSSVAGEADVLLVPNIHAGNILGKALTIHCRARMAGFILGAAAPVIMTSRASSADEKYLSTILATAASRR